jgi:hypothetical protein
VISDKRRKHAKGKEKRRSMLLIPHDLFRQNPLGGGQGPQLGLKGGGGNRVLKDQHLTHPESPKFLGILSLGICRLCLTHNP